MPASASHSSPHTRPEEDNVGLDWLITPIRSVVPLIETGFEHIFERDALTWKAVSDHWHVTDERYGLIAMHQFRSRDDADADVVTQRLRERGRALLGLLDDAAPIVFVRRWHPVDEEVDSQAARDLCTFLTARKPNCVLLYLQPHDAGEPFIDGNHIACYNPPTQAVWTGDDTYYDRNFSLANRLTSDLFGDNQT